MKRNLLFIVFYLSMNISAQGSEYFVIRYTGATDKSLVPLIVTKNQVSDEKIRPVFYSDFDKRVARREEERQIFIDLSKRHERYISLNDSDYIKFINLATVYHPQEAVDTTFQGINVSLYHYKNGVLNTVRLMNREECRLYLTKLYEGYILESFSEGLKKGIREYLHYIDPAYFDTH